MIEIGLNSIHWDSELAALKFSGIGAALLAVNHSSSANATAAINPSCVWVIFITQAQIKTNGANPVRL